MLPAGSGLAAWIRTMASAHRAAGCLTSGHMPAGADSEQGVKKCPVIEDDAVRPSSIRASRLPQPAEEVSRSAQRGRAVG